jgi:hypothetical protein
VATLDETNTVLRELSQRVDDRINGIHLFLQRDEGKRSEKPEQIGDLFMPASSDWDLGRRGKKGEGLACKFYKKLKWKDILFIYLMKTRFIS